MKAFFLALFTSIIVFASLFFTGWSLAAGMDKGGDSVRCSTAVTIDDRIEFCPGTSIAWRIVEASPVYKLAYWLSEPRP